MDTYTFKQRLVAEFVSTFCLVLIGCGAMVVDAKTEALTHVGVATVWGLVVMVMVYAVGRVSGAHMNPAVTISLTAIGRFPVKDCVSYVAVQCFGSCAAAVALVAVLGNELANVGATTSSISIDGALMTEAMMTAILMFVVLCVSTGAKEEAFTAGLAVGATIGMEAFVAGPLTKASMNPARSLGPALAAAASEPRSQLWIYLVAPIVGALIGAFVYKTLEPTKSA